MAEGGLAVVYIIEMFTTDDLRGFMGYMKRGSKADSWHTTSDRDDAFTFVNKSLAYELMACLTDSPVYSPYFFKLVAIDR